MEIEWGEPPPKKKSGSKGTSAVAFVEMLKQRPGEWAKYPVRATGPYADGLRRRHPGTEWTTRTTDEPKRCDIYGRWVGLNGEHR